jgi:tetratricopeptide (TPR) repeat protein
MTEASGTGSHDTPDSFEMRTSRKPDASKKPDVSKKPESFKKPEVSRRLESFRKSDSSKKQEVSRNGSLQEGIRLYRLKRWDLALAELLGVNTDRLNPEENTELSYYLGLSYTKLERYDDALLYLEQVVTSGKDMLRGYQCRMTLAYIYVITRRSKMAEFELKRLANNGFESAQLYSTLAYAAWAQKHFKQSVEYYEKALDLDENNATALNGLGFILADNDMDPIRGLRCCRKAVDLKPQNAAYLDSLGWAFYKNGELLEARTWLRRAMEAAPNQTEIKEHFQTVTGAK